MVSIPTELRQLVIDRANSQCEYCLLHQDYSIYTHEVDHIIALKHSGQTVAHNLALSCLSCNRHKGSDFATIDPNSGEIIPLFNPRRLRDRFHKIAQKARVFCFSLWECDYLDSSYIVKMCYHRVSLDI